MADEVFTCPNESRATPFSSRNSFISDTICDSPTAIRAATLLFPGWKENKEITTKQLTDPLLILQKITFLKATIKQCNAM